MARMREAIFELLLPSDKIPELWEPYYIAANQKYGQKAGARENCSYTWYKKLNRWLNLTDDVLEVLGETASQIAQRDVLYEWANFVRYLIYDTKIVRQDHRIMADLVPHNALPAETENLFTLICLLAGADRPIKLYQDQGLGEQAVAAFGVIGSLLTQYERVYHRWGIPGDAYIMQLATASLYAFEGLAFTYEKADLPGTIYRNSRSGELVMLAKPGQLYNARGRRLEEAEEQKILKNRARTNPLIDEEQLQNQTENETMSTVSALAVSQLPEGIWETRFFATESGGFVGNELGPDSFAKASVRIFEAGHWKSIVTDESQVLTLHITDTALVNRERLRKATRQLMKTITFRDGNPDILVYQSWLMDPLLLQKIENQDLTQFVKLFRLFPVYPRPAETYQKIFGEDVRRRPVADWPEESIYQTGAKRLVEAGGEPCRVGGYALLELLQGNEKTSKTE